MLCSLFDVVTVVPSMLDQYFKYKELAPLVKILSILQEPSSHNANHFVSANSPLSKSFAKCA